jgi:Mg-chelatase subunit ChlD/phosphopantetheinyl transferase (holo-ACP synthase)
MEQTFAKIDWMEELIESGADAQVTEEFASKLEEEFVATANAHLQMGDPMSAVEQYFLALQLPNRAATREEIFRRAVRSFLLFNGNGNTAEIAEKLKVPRFKNLLAELMERVEAEKRRNVDEQFDKLDSCSSLRAKNFAGLEAILKQMGESITTRYLVARIRLVREKKAQEFFNQIITKVQSLANELDLHDFTDEAAAEIHELRKQAVVFSTGIHPAYGDQIREYIEQAEELFTKSHTETVIDEIHRAGSKLVQDEFVEFKEQIKPDIDPVALLNSLVKALRIFKGEALFSEIQKVGARWAMDDGRLRFKLQAVEEPDTALVQVNRSLAIIDEHRSILPLEISNELRDFLITLREELSQREIPNVFPFQTPGPPAEKIGCLARLLSWLPGSTSLMKQLIIVIVFCASIALGISRASAQTDVVIAVDLSGTMKQNDPDGLRYHGADQFLSMLSYYTRNQNRGAVVTFGNSAHELMPFGYVSRDKAGKYHDLFANLPVEDWTELGHGLQLAQQAMGSARSRNRSIILISDGYIEGNPDTRRMDRDQARVAAESELWQRIVPSLQSAGIKVYTIGLYKANDRGRPLMDRLARETGGTHNEVTDPRQFYEIYKKMLDDIEPPSGVADIKGENTRFPLTPADYGVIITGRGDFSVRAPNGMIYPSKESNPDPTVSQQYIQYPGGQGVLFLGQPATSEQQLSSHWTGEWGINVPDDGEGQITYLSSVRFLSAGNMPPRRGFFKNEYVPIDYALELRPDLDEKTKSFLGKCQTHYTMVRTDQNTGWSKSGTIDPKEFKYTEYALVDQAGEFLMQVEMTCQNITYRKTRQKFHVFDAELLKIGFIDASTQKAIQGQALNEGGKILIAGQINTAEIAKYFPECRGLKDQKLGLRLRYNSNPPNEMTLDAQSGQLMSAEHEVEEKGTLNIETELAGNMIVQRTDGEGMIYYPVRAKSVATVQVKASWSGFIDRVIYILSLVATLTGLFVFIRHKQWRSVDSMTLEASGGFSRPFEAIDLSILERLKRAFSVRGGPHYSIGGPESKADVTVSTGPKDIIAEIGKDIFNNFYIVQKGVSQVYLGRQRDPLEANIRRRLEPNDVIVVEGKEMTFKPTFDEAGD